MALRKEDLQVVALICSLNFMFVLGCANDLHCSNESASCSCQQSQLFTNSSDCMIDRLEDCSSQKFDSGSFSELGLVRLEPVDRSARILVNLTLHDISWTALRFRYMEKRNEEISKTFCRKITVTSKSVIPELFYDCNWTPGAGSITLEYEAERGSDRQTGMYFFRLPDRSSLVAEMDEIDSWAPFVYVDISKPVFTAKWQPSKLLGKQKFEVKVCDEDVLVQKDEVEGYGGQELSYSFRQEWFPSYGNYYFKVRLLRNYTNSTCVMPADDCTERIHSSQKTCGESETPPIHVGSSSKVAINVGIVGGVLLICLILIILFVWKKCKPSSDATPPKLLIVYAQSTASHIRVVEEFAKYLNKHCYIEAMLDQLDIPETETKDPYEWYNNAMAEADFVMVVASPPSCCRHEGLYRDAHITALRLLTNYLADRDFRGQCLAVVLPHCKVTHLPSEARSFRRFFLPRQLNAMLWFLFRDARFPAFVNAAFSLLGPAPRGGSTEFKMGGADLMDAVRVAQNDVTPVCKCKTHSNNSDITNVVPSHVQITPDVTLMEMTSNDVIHSDVPNCDLIQFQPIICLDNLDLTGEMQPPERKQNSSHTMLDLDSMVL